MEGDSWKPGATAVFRLDSTDVDTRTAYDGDGCTFIVYDEDDVLVQSETAMVNESTGLYRGYWDIPSDQSIGNYYVIITFTNLDTKVFKKRKDFVIY